VAAAAARAAVAAAVVAAPGPDRQQLNRNTTMKNSLMMVICALALIAAAAPVAKAQFPEDALRYSWQGLGSGGRSLAMGTSGMSFMSDYSAVYWNPAGIAQAKMSDFSAGLSYISYQNTATFLGTQSSFTNNNTSLDNLGLIYAVPVTRGSLSLGFGYDRSDDFTTGLSYTGFNPRSSIVQSWAPNGQPTGDLSSSRAWQLYLTDTLHYPNQERIYYSPIMDSVDQFGSVIEGGGMGRYSFSIASEVARNLYVGLALNFLSGSYSYASQFNESDARSIYQNYPFDYNGLQVVDLVEADISGFTMNTGMIYKISPNVRFGLAMRTPSWITVQEHFSSDATSWFDNGDSYHDPYGGDPGGYTEYDVTTPYVFSTGVSGGTGDFTLSGALEFTDYTQMEFNNASNSLMVMNTEIKSLFRSAINLRLGGEAKIPTTDLVVRAGYILLESPYEGDPSSFNRTYITGGLGLLIDRVVGVDLAYAHGSWDSYRWIYGDVKTTVENVTTHNFKGTLSFLF
jgi:long-subunit fatty acid transport protein